MEDTGSRDAMAHGDGSESGSGPVRNVTLSNSVKVVFSDASGGAREPVSASRDIYSVMDVILAKVTSMSSKEELDRCRVSVHSVEDPSKSDPVPEGGEPYEGPYMGGLEIERVGLQEAVSMLASFVIPSDRALKSMEGLCSQFFLRTRMDGCVFVASSDGHCVSTTLVNSLRDVNPESVGALYRGMLKAAEELKASTARQFPDMEVDWDRDPGAARVEEGVPASSLLLPSGIPASFRDRGVVTPKDIRDAGPKVVRLY